MGDETVEFCLFLHDYGWDVDVNGGGWRKGMEEGRMSRRMVGMTDSVVDILFLYSVSLGCDGLSVKEMW